MTGWELDHNQVTHWMQTGDYSLIDLFLEDYYPLAAINEFHGEILLIIRKYHPTLNVSTCNPAHPTNDYSTRLAVYTREGYFFCFLPKTYNYTGLTIEGAPRDNKVCITTEEKGIIETNTIELLYYLGGSYLSPSQIQDQQVLEERFLSLNNTYKGPKYRETPITQTEIISSVLGSMKQYEFDDWWLSESVASNYWGINLPVIYNQFDPNQKPEALKRRDKALKNFLALNSKDRIAISTQVNKNCQNFLQMIEPGENDELMLAIKNDDEKIWQFVHPEKIYVEEYKGDIYVCLLCNCDWETEHGLQLIYKNGNELTRVSQQDGRITE